MLRSMCHLNKRQLFRVEHPDGFHFQSVQIIIYFRSHRADENDHRNNIHGIPKMNAFHMKIFAMNENHSVMLDR